MKSLQQFKTQLSRMLMVFKKINDVKKDTGLFFK